MENIAVNATQIKAILADCQGSALEMLIAVLGSVGILASRELADATGLTIRSIQKAKQRTTGREPQDAREFRDASYSSPANHRTPESEPQDAIPPTDSRARAYKESTIVDSSISFSTPFDQRVKFENGRLIVCDEVRREWVERFGSEERFDLALLQAQGYVQPNSMRPLEAQLSAQLARSVADKRDRDERYARAATSSKNPSLSAPKAPVGSQFAPRVMSAETRQLLREAGCL